MYTYSIPINNDHFESSGRDRVVAALKQAGITRAFLATGALTTDETENKRVISLLRENLAYLKKEGFETGVWYWAFMCDDGGKFTKITGINGHPSANECCPSDPEFRRFAADFTRRVAELGPDIIAQYAEKLGITVVIITHQMSVVKEVCNHVAILDDGIIAEEGLVSSVFTSPKSEAARHLVFPGGEDMTVSDPLHERRLKLTFLNVAATSVPLVARLATEEGISANVISATTQKLSDEIYGSMLLGIPNSQFDKATAFLKSFENIKVEEVSADD